MACRLTLYAARMSLQQREDDPGWSSFSSGPAASQAPSATSLFHPAAPKPGEDESAAAREEALLHGQPDREGRWSQAATGSMVGRAVCSLSDVWVFRQPWKADLSARVSARVLPHLPVQYPGLPVALDIGL